MTSDDEPQTAMLLTEQEWVDLADMVSHFRDCTEWADDPPAMPSEISDHTANIRRKRTLAQRIIDAT